MDLSTIPIPQNVEVGTEGVLRRFSGNSGSYERFLTEFLPDPMFQDVTNVFETEDTQVVLISTHTFKGLTASLGLTKLYGVSSEMVDCIRGDKSAEALGKYGESKRVYDGICEVLSKA